MSTVLEKKNINSLFVELENDHLRSEPMRDLLIEKLSTSIGAMTLNLDSEDAEQLEVKLRAIDSLNKVVNDRSAATFKRVSIYQRDKEGETNDKLISAMTSQIFENMRNKPMRLSDGPVNKDDELALLDLAYEESGMVIRDTELKEDPDDLNEE